MSAYNERDSMTNERILNPAFVPGTAETAHEAKAAANIAGLEQQRLALLVNAWPSWVTMADHFNERLSSTYEGLTITKYVVPNGSAAAPELLEEISRDNDIAVVGLANCGSCTAWSFHDSAELKKTGMPVVWVATNEFEGLARGLSDAQVGLMGGCRPESKFEFTDASMGVNAFFGLTR